MKSAQRCILFMLCLLLAACDGEFVEVEKVLGYRGKARVNPFLAAERTLDKLGHNAERKLYLTKMPESNGVMLLSAEGGLSEGRMRQILDWVDGGGHLIYCLSGCRAYNDHASGIELGMNVLQSVLEEEGDPLLRELEIEVKSWDKENLEKAIKKFSGKFLDDLKEAAEKTEKPKSEDEEKKPAANTADPKELVKKMGDIIEQVIDDQMADFNLKWRDQTFHLKLAGFQSMAIKRKLRGDEFVVGKKNTAAALHLMRGAGRITVLAHARPFRNRWLEEYDHARWLAELVGGDAERQVHFVAGATASFWALLWDRAWMVLLTLMLCIAFWLWRHMARFGPLERVELDETRHFASHIAALGQFFWRMRRPDVLVQSSREAVWQILRERHASIDAHSRHLSDALAQSIATRCNLPVERVTAAFDVPTPQSAHNFLALIRDLQTMRMHL